MDNNSSMKNQNEDSEKVNSKEFTRGLYNHLVNTGQINPKDYHDKFMSKHSKFFTSV